MWVLLPLRKNERKLKNQKKEKSEKGNMEGEEEDGEAAADATTVGPMFLSSLG